MSNVTAGERIDAALDQGRAALVAYLPAGYPDLATSVEAARVAVDNGADVVELGLPYSDPSMDGPLIQRATEDALSKGTRTREVLSAVEQVAATGAAVLVMTYYNPVFAYGVERFAADLASAGGAGLITPDLVPEEAGRWTAAADEHGLDKVFLVAPASSDARLATVSAASRGFVYVASRMGVTGVQDSLAGGGAELVARTRAAGAERACVGIGVSDRAQAAEVAAYADGVIVGSALIKALGSGGAAEGLSALGALTAELAEGVREGRA
ncbi:tryptophan synthase subunit alpha [Georgenia sp. Z1344]|uniref:tryptophan synthase subunit alpha n=1 Tax=Georgenia sp. Z1344 TaxID=3416706 RepID=UPI003CF2C0A6